MEKITNLNIDDLYKVLAESQNKHSHNYYENSYEILIPALELLKRSVVISSRNLNMALVKVMCRQSQALFETFIRDVIVRNPKLIKVTSGKTRITSSFNTLKKALSLCISVDPSVPSHIQAIFSKI